MDTTGGFAQPRDALHALRGGARATQPAHPAPSLPRFPFPRLLIVAGAEEEGVLPHPALAARNHAAAFAATRELCFVALATQGGDYVGRARLRT